MAPLAAPLSRPSLRPTPLGASFVRALRVGGSKGGGEVTCKSGEQSLPD